MPLNLSSIETRILGCLIEKERTTPDAYPLSLNSLVLACNQTTNRDPITAYAESEIDDGLFSLREKKLVTVIFGGGSRVQKYRHTIPDQFDLTRQDFAVMSVLLLRGPQTAGELRTRTERMYHFQSLPELEQCMTSLAHGDSPLVKLLPQQPGQKEPRYTQLFSAEPEGGWQSVASSPAPVARAPRADDSRLATLESEIASLREEITTLKSDFAAFRKQFE